MRSLSLSVSASTGSPQQPRALSFPLCPPGMLRLAKYLTLALLALGAVVSTSAQESTSHDANVSLRGACESKCVARKDACSADCEEAMGMALDQSFVTTCQTECAREKEYCNAGCSVLTAA